MWISGYMSRLKAGAYITVWITVEFFILVSSEFVISFLRVKSVTAELLLLLSSHLEGCIFYRYHLIGRHKTGAYEHQFSCSDLWSSNPPLSGPGGPVEPGDRDYFL